MAGKIGKAMAVVTLAGSSLIATSFARAAEFEEFPIGPEKTVGPLEIGAVYFQPVNMEPLDMGGLPASKSDMHLEADIKAAKDNRLGYEPGSFVPYLTVKCEIQKQGGKVIKGTFMPMSASDGPHYGNNIKLDGPVIYKVTFLIDSPEKQGYLLHTDKVTGVTGYFWKNRLRSVGISITYPVSGNPVST